MKRTQHYLNELARNTDFFYTTTEDELNALKECFLDIYKDIEGVCNKYHLTVMVGGGTAIGAIRHQGFIPWDDDFDMIMEREDFEKFKTVFKKELSNRYILSCPGIEEESKTLFLQVIKKGTTMVCADDLNRPDANGVRVDIYPIDRMPNNKIWRNIKCKLLDLIRIIAISTSIYKTKNKLFKQVFQENLTCRIYYRIRWMIGMIFSIFGKKNWYDLHNWFASSSKGTKFCSVPTCDLAEKELQPRDVFFPPRKVMFEGIEMNAPHQLEKYLTKLYGNYMELPPLEERERHFYVKLDLNQ